MATPLVIEEESGTLTGTQHPHNGYYAGDFSGLPIHDLTRTSFATGRDRQAHRGASR